VGSGANYLRGVSCTSSTSCTAVGDYYNSVAGATQTLIESWDGSHWSTVASPNTGPSTNQLFSVSCFSSSHCTAVGHSGLNTLTESWDGVNWTVVASPNVGTGANQLLGASCSASSACMGVG